MPRYSLKAFLIATILIAIGVALLSKVIMFPRNAPVEWWYVYAAALAWFGGGMLIGAGLLAPFKKIWLGVLIGLAVMAVITGLLFLFTDPYLFADPFAGFE